MDKVIEILNDIKSGIDYKTESALVDNSVLDSFDIVQLVTRLNDEFDIEIDSDEIIPANFNSADAIWKMVQRLQD